MSDHRASLPNCRYCGLADGAVDHSHCEQVFREHCKPMSVSSDDCSVIARLDREAFERELEAARAEAAQLRAEHTYLQIALWCVVKHAGGSVTVPRKIAIERPTDSSIEAHLSHDSTRYVAR